MEMAPRNYRFLSPVVVELVLKIVELFNPGNFSACAQDLVPGVVEVRAQDRNRRFIAFLSGTKKRGFLNGFFARLCASRGCGALSAKCTLPGPISLGSFSFLGSDTG